MKKSAIIYLLIVFLLSVLFFLVENLSYKGVDFDKFTPFCDTEKTYNGAIITTSMPKINASVAFYPFASQLVESICPKEIYNGELNYLSTYEAYKSIIENTADVAICSETSSTQKAILDSLSGDIAIIPIAKDGLVFYVSDTNKVQELSNNELNNIYCGNISNWKELGGMNIKIRPYQLEKDVGGSEACFASLVDNELVIRKENLIAYDMKNIIDLTSRHYGGIGYAFNQFYEKMYNQKTLKKVTIDGIVPNYENISQGKYPFMFNIYLVYRRSSQNENIIKILNWINSEEGKNLIINCGLQPINE